MICPRCRTALPESKLACATCATRQGLASLRAQQPDYLRRVIAGIWKLRAVMADRGPRHLLLFGAETQTYCGALITEGRRQLLDLDDLRLVNTCADCLETLANAMEDL